MGGLAMADEITPEGGILVPAELQPAMEELLQHSWMITYQFTVPKPPVDGCYLVPFASMEVVKVEKL